MVRVIEASASHARCSSENDETMGNLTVHLQDRFIDCCPPGWVAHREVRLLPPEFEQWVGYQARADILLEQPEQQRRLWIEFEVSRADPVANHAKFATTHLFFPQRMGDVFVSMVSAHVVRGRVNPDANTIVLMRQVGMSAFQTNLLPSYSGEAIKQLNHLYLAQLKSNPVDVSLELERVILLSEPLWDTDIYRLHFVGNLLEVMLNLRGWNAQMTTKKGRQLWGCRTITYFVYDPVSSTFAPSKFCAYLTISKPVNNPKLPLDTPNLFSGLSIAEYLDFQGDAKFEVL